MRRTEPPFDEAAAIARLREVWQWAIASNRHFVAYLIGVAILAFEHDDGRGRFKPPRKGEDEPASDPRPKGK